MRKGSLENVEEININLDNDSIAVRVLYGAVGFYRSGHLGFHYGFDYPINNDDLGWLYGKEKYW